MQGETMLKFEFSILSRNGQKIDSIQIAGKDQADAERKLKQMYRHCEVISCETKQDNQRHSLHAASVEDILSLISK